MTETAKALGISRKTLSEIVNGKSPITPDIAVRLERAFNNPPADMWLRLQAAYDLRRAKQRLKKNDGAPFAQAYVGTPASRSVTRCPTGSASTTSSIR